jgi:hypothetical protein
VTLEVPAEVVGLVEVAELGAVVHPVLVQIFLAVLAPAGVRVRVPLGRDAVPVEVAAPTPGIVVVGVAVRVLESDSTRELLRR